MLLKSESSCFLPSFEIKYWEYSQNRTKRGQEHLIIKKGVFHLLEFQSSPYRSGKCVMTVSYMRP